MPHREPNPSRSAGRSLLVYLHGFAESPSTIPSFARDRAEDGWLRLCPTGPIPANRGFSWFDTGARGVDARSLEGAVTLVDGVIEATIAELTQGGPRPAEPVVVLGGCSQGAATALAVAALTGRPIAGLLLQAGFIPEGLDVDIDLAGLRTDRVLIQHGTNDEVVPAFIAHDLAASIRAARPEVAVELQTFDHGHETSDAMMAAAQVWLSSVRTSVGDTT